MSLTPLGWKFSDLGELMGEGEEILAETGFRAEPAFCFDAVKRVKSFELPANAWKMLGMPGWISSSPNSICMAELSLFS
jgi:hypothetical protein